MDKPIVVVHTIASLDGRVSLGPDRTGFDDVLDRRWGALMATGETLDERSRRLEALHHPQVFLEGSGSFVTETTPLAPLPPVEGRAADLLEDYLPEAILSREGHVGWFAAVDGRGRLRSGMKEFEGWPGWHALHLVSRGAPPEYLAFLRKTQIPYLVSGAERVDLAAALAKLKVRLGISCVVSTAGARLNGALLRAGLVDEVNIEFFPTIIGGTRTPALFDGPDLAPGDWPCRLELISAEVRPKGPIWLRYKVIPPVRAT